LLGKRIKPFIVVENEIWVRGMDDTPGMPTDQLQRENVAVVKENRRRLRKGEAIKPWVDPEIAIRHEKNEDRSIA
jgi:hypothetical protein